MRRLLVIAAAACCCGPPSSAASLQVHYPYHSAAFTAFVRDSCRQTHALTPADFYRWMNVAFTGASGAQDETGLSRELERRAKLIEAQRNPLNRAYHEAETGAWVHKTIKKMIPRFSLQRGFEFTNVVTRGERQCLLQSVLIAGLLQSMGMDAGVVMVYRNPQGQTSNNGHAATLIKLANGRDLIVDASEAHPYARHQGLFAHDRLGGFAYLDPVYRPNSNMIVSYRAAATRQRIPVTRVETMDTAFLRSQLEYYRGEQASGGLLAQSPSPEGLRDEAQHLRASVRLCPANPLPVYMLGRVCLRQKDLRTAREELKRAEMLYRKAGWAPEGVLDALREARAR